MEAAFRRLVTRSCEICEWRRESVESRTQDVGCPLCHAPTKIVKQELLVPFVPGKNGVAASLSRLGASKGGKRRAERLTAGRRRDIARAAALARWRR
jgi:hypothetical protein